LNSQAPSGFVWVCRFCGKRSRDRYGDQAVDFGWDESCMMNALLVSETDLILDATGRVIGTKENANE
jgi:hypothetical protein